MKSRTLKSAAFMCCMFLFACLVIAGSPRLIGSSVDPEKGVPLIDVSAVPAAFTAAPAVRLENGSPVVRTQSLHKQFVSFFTVRPRKEVSVLSDANGNVLGHRSYIHEVYQAFVLNDGFV